MLSLFLVQAAFWRGQMQWDFFLHDIILPMNTVDNIFFHWEVLRKKGMNNFERESVCNWVYQNLDCLIRYVPRGFPRTRKVVEFNTFTVLGSIFGGITLLVVIISFCLIIKWKSRRFIRFAQIDALLMTAVGKFFLSSWMSEMKFYTNN